LDCVGIGATAAPRDGMMSA